MSDDPYAAFASPLPIAAPAASEQAADPYAAFASQVTPQAPAGIKNVPTAKDDPVYHGAVPIAQAPDQGAQTAFETGIGGVPIVGPAILSGVERAAAGARALTGGGTYDGELAKVQEMDTIARQQHPVAAVAGDVVGAGLAMAPAIAAAPAAFGVEGGLTAGNVAAGTLTGGAIGGADGAVRSGGDASSITKGVVGGALGGAAGPVLGAVGGRIVTGIADAAASGAALRNVGVSRPAAEIITRAAANDGSLDGAGAARIAAAGPGAMLADAGPGAANVLDTAIARGGQGAVTARNVIEARAAGANDDLTQAMDATLGAPQGVETATNAIRDSTAAARGAAYDTAYAAPIDYTTDAGRSLENIVATRVPASIIARANAQMRIDGNQSQQIMARVLPDGSVTYDQMPDVRQIDYMKRALQDVSRMGDGQGALGGNTAEGRSYGNLATELRNNLVSAVPAYGDALSTAAQPIEAKNALDFGSTMLRSTVPRDMVANTVEGMTQPEIAAVRQGVRSSIDETMANVKTALTDPNMDAREVLTPIKDFSSRAAQQKLGMILDPGELQTLNDALTRSTAALQLRANIAANSKTFARQTTDQGVKQATEPGALGKLLQGHPYDAGKAAVQFVTGNTPANIAARQDAIYGELASTLTGPRGPQATGLLDRITQANNTRAGVHSFATSIPYGGVAQGGILSTIPALNERSR